MGLLPRSQRLHGRYALSSRIANRAFRPRVPGLHPRPSRFLPRRSRRNGRQPDRRRYLRRRHGLAPILLPPYLAPLRDARPQCLHLLVLDTSWRRSPRHVWLPRRQAGRLASVWLTRRRLASPFNATNNRSTLKNRTSMDYTSVIDSRRAIVRRVRLPPTRPQS